MPPGAYVRYFFRSAADQTAAAAAAAVMGSQAQAKDESPDMVTGVTRIEKKNDEKRDSEEDNQLVIHPTQSTLNPTATEWKPFQITSDNEDSTKSEVESITATDTDEDENEEDDEELDESQVVELVANQINEHCPNCSRLCFICEQDKAGAVMVPCGHGGFCYACAVNIASLTDATCPTCHVPLQMALKIL